MGLNVLFGCLIQSSVNVKMLHKFVANTYETRVFKKVNRLLKCHLTFMGSHTYNIKHYIYI